MTNLNEQIIDAFIESEADAEIIDKENEEEILFNLRVLNALSVCEEKFINDCGEGGSPSKVKLPYLQYDMVHKL